MSKIIIRKHFKAPKPDVPQLCYTLYWDEVWKGTSPLASRSLASSAGEELWHLLALPRQDNEVPGHREHPTPGGPLRHTYVNNIPFSPYLVTP